jgi:predicted O-methyltransferase YrrM
MIREHLPKGGVVAEVGVGEGVNAFRILDGSRPRELNLVDKDFSHLHRHRFEAGLRDGTVRLHERDSATALASFPDEYFDWIYIDADHSYDGIRRDIEQAKRKVKHDGLLVFNDYLLFSHKEFVSYGVVAAVNELCVTDGWELRYFALAPHMYCDVAIGRIGGS